MGFVGAGEILETGSNALRDTVKLHIQVHDRLWVLWVHYNWDLTAGCRG